MSQSHARRFRDKLAMRTLARAAGVPVPEFTSVFNDDRLREFMERVPPPWLLKPRSEASSMGITTIHHPEELWPVLDRLGDERSFCWKVPSGSVSCGRAGGGQQVYIRRGAPLRSPRQRLSRRQGLRHIDPGPPLVEQSAALNHAPLEGPETVRARSTPNIRAEATISSLRMPPAWAANIAKRSSSPQG
jgi:hypothetical protein